MSFSQATIRDVTIGRRDAELAVSWVSSSASGTWFQVYVDGDLAWYGTARTCLLPHPSQASRGQSIRIEVGTVAAAEVQDDFSASLPAAIGGGQRVTLSWIGGTCLAADIEGFHVYQGTTAGGAVDYSAPVATIAAYPQGVLMDGFGMGGFGDPGFGCIASSYAWTSKPLTPGTWNFAVKPFDLAGNEGSATTSSATVAGPLRPPARDTNGRRVAYTLNRSTAGGFGTGGFGAGGFADGTGFGLGGFGLGGFGAGAGLGDPYVTLTWQASPGY